MTRVSASQIYVVKVSRDLNLLTFSRFRWNWRTRFSSLRLSSLAAAASRTSWACPPSFRGTGFSVIFVNRFGFVKINNLVWQNSLNLVTQPPSRGSYHGLCWRLSLAVRRTCSRGRCSSRDSIPLKTKKKMKHVVGKFSSRNRECIKMPQKSIFLSCWMKKMQDRFSKRHWISNVRSWKKIYWKAMIFEWALFTALRERVQILYPISMDINRFQFDVHP